MAPWASLRRLARVAALPAAVALISPASAGEVCSNSSGESEDVQLLQQVGRPGTTKQSRGQGCVHGRSVADGAYCHCHPGWKGGSCEEPADACPFEITRHPHQDNDGRGKCGLGFTVYPYIQANLWGSAYEGWETCAGKQQSPINILCLGAKRVSGRKLDVDLGESSEKPDHVTNNGHALEVDGDFGTLTLGRTTYEVQNLHFHSPSEHTIDWKHAAMEMHIVTKSKRGALAVVGILFDIGEKNECLEKVFAAPAPIAGCENPVGNIDASCFDEQLSGSYWSYDGSLTTPPCTEGLKWQVMKRRATISWEQLQVYKTRYQMNARPVQPLNGRTVTYNTVK